MTIATVLSVFLPSVKLENKSLVFMDDNAAARAKVFSKEAIYDPEIPKYSSENDHTQNVNI